VPQPILIRERQFCDRCRAESSDASTGSIATMNGVGRTLYGGADRCAACGSVVRTLWWVIFMVPIVPRGSYRCLAVGDIYGSEHFLSRRTAWRWGQVLGQWAIGLGLGAALFAILRAWI
jgi:hypothetical protein